jgi:hypothetical protein
MKIFGREPALWINAISAGLGILVSFGLTWMDDGKAAAIVAVLTAGAAVLTAASTRPIALSAFTGFIGTVAILAAAYGFDVSQQTVGAVQLAVVAVLTLLARGQITPTADPRPLPESVPARLRR